MSSSEIMRKRGGISDEASSGRRKSVKRQASFKPQPVPNPLHSSDTPPDDDDEVDIPPPPPSERKIARRRDSTRAIREREASPISVHKKQKITATTSISTSRSKVPLSSSFSSSRAHDALISSLSADISSEQDQLISSGPPPKVDFLNFSVSQRSRPTAPRPSSPPRAPIPRKSISSKALEGSMGPPSSTTYIRKTRKSVHGPGGFSEEISREAVIPVPEGETPVIRKNRNMRDEQSRRSSLGMRGQRASSSLGKGDISIPHPGVESTSFYKHINPGLPEPIRARHLLVYVGKRVTDKHLAESLAERGNSSSSKSRKKKDGKNDVVKTEEGDRVVKDIMDDFMTSLAKGLIETNVFSQAGPSNTGVPLRSHPKNVTNKEAEKHEEALIKRCKEEKIQWKQRGNQVNARQADLVQTLRQKQQLNALEDSTPDMTNAPEWITRALGVAKDVLKEGEGDLMNMGEFPDVEYKVDLLHATSHAAVQYSRQTSRFLDGFFNALSTDLKNRESAGSSSSKLPSSSSTDPDNTDPISLLSSAATGSKKQVGSSKQRLDRTDPMTMLRALAAADAKELKEDVQEVANRVAAVPSTSATAPSTSIAAATPRRGGMTPRRPATGTATPGGQALPGTNTSTTPKSLPLGDRS